MSSPFSAARGPIHTLIVQKHFSFASSSIPQTHATHCLDSALFLAAFLFCCLFPWLCRCPVDWRRINNILASTHCLQLWQPKSLQTAKCPLGTKNSRVERHCAGDDVPTSLHSRNSCFLVLMMTTIPTFHFPAPLCFPLGFPGSECLLHPGSTQMEFRRCLSFYSYIVEHLHSPKLHFLHSQSWKKMLSMTFQNLANLMPLLALTTHV